MEACNLPWDPIYYFSLGLTFLKMEITKQIPEGSVRTRNDKSRASAPSPLVSGFLREKCERGLSVGQPCLHF